MPRLPPSLVRRAHRISPHLAALLPVCRDLGSARNELRWIREYVASVTTPSNNIGKQPSRNGAVAATSKTGNGIADWSENALLRRLCRRRGRGAPLQYVLGSQPFGDLEIKCRPGVLIPRPETEAWVTHLAGVVRGAWRGSGSGNAQDEDGVLEILDLCTGSGCIALLLSSLLRRQFPNLNVRGLDVEPRAVALARENLRYNMRRGLLPPSIDGAVTFDRADIFSAEWLEPLLLHGDSSTQVGTRRGVVDVLVSNPPYISASGFARDTERSVRNYEPKLALVPGPLAGFPSHAVGDCRPEDVFYARILDVAMVLRPRFVVLEVGDLAQGLRVVGMARGRCGDAEVEVWRDWPDMRPSEDEPETAEVGGVEVPVRGSGNGRAVFIHRTV